VSPPPEAKPSKPAASPGEKRGNKPSGEKGFWKQRIADNRFPEPTGEVGQAIDLRGRKGPAVEVEEWLTAAPDAQDKVIILDFWATWCGPCIRGIPHMNQLQSAYPDEVVVIGLSNEDAATVRAFLPNSGMRYAVGVDPQRRMWKAVQNQTIPHAIVYSPDGVVRWQGHPARLTPEILGAIVEGSRQ
jgi:cytochrome c biogenesis protein CcmG/thiol:disulfide interchange protein DsbE